MRDRVEAWKFGPVIPKLYHALKHCKDGPVIAEINASELEFVDIETDLLQQVFEAYGDLSGIALSRLTHRAKTPWDEVYVPDASHIPIPNDIIEEHYKELAEG